MEDCSCLNKNGGLLGSQYLLAPSNSSSGAVLGVLIEASRVITGENSLHRACGQQMPSSLSLGVLCMGKMSFNYVQKFIKNRLGVYPFGKRSNANRPEGQSKVQKAL